MKGIAVIGGECPSKKVLQEIIHADDVLIAADSGLIPLEEAGFVPHFIVGDMDSLDTIDRLKKYPSEKIIRFNTDKDYTDTELALNLLMQKNCEEIWIIGGGGGRIDHLFALYALFEREKAPNRWFIPYYELRLIKTQTVLELPKNCQISLFPLGSGPWKIESRGIKWPLDNLPWERGFCSISNITNDDVQELNPLQGRFLLIIPKANS
jgi:thiamine pyrophosphokinase